MRKWIEFTNPELLESFLKQESCPIRASWESIDKITYKVHLNFSKESLVDIYYFKDYSGFLSMDIKTLIVYCGGGDKWIETGFKTSTISCRDKNIILGFEDNSSKGILKIEDKNPYSIPCFETTFNYCEAILKNIDV